MKSVVSFLAFSLALIPVGQVQAQEPVEMQLEFVRRLRAKGYNDLALEQIDKLKKLADPALTGVLQLEQARTMLAIAREKEPEARPALFAAARAELEAFVRKNPAGPEGAQGRLEIARLAALEGQALLTRALREDDPAVAKRAEQQFIQAGQELEAAAKVLANVIADLKDDGAVKKQLSQDLLRARFDRASNFIDQALTYLDISSEVANRKRAEVVDQARQAFLALADDGGPTGLLASAWLIKVNQEAQAPVEAERFRKRVMDATGKSAQAAQRFARLFYMQGVLKNPTIKLDNAKKYRLIEDEGKKWLAAYPAFARSPEGWAVRFEMAQAMYLQAQGMTKDPKAPPTPAALAILNQAQKHFAAVAESDSNLAEKAKAFNVNISILKLGEKTAVADLKDFDNCYLKAQVEMFEMKKVAAELAGGAKDPEKLEAKRKGHLHEALKALTRGIMLADAKTSPQSLDEARYYLATGYLMAGDFYRAAVAGEALGRLKPPTKRSAQAAGYAIEAYANILQKDNADINRQHLKDLADYVLSPEAQKIWSSEPVTAVARYQMAMLYNKDNDYKEAIALLDKLTPDFSGYIYAQGQLVFIAQEAREKAKSDEEKKAYAEIARKAILRTPSLPGDADPNSAAMYFFSQLELPKFHYFDAAGAMEKKELPKAETLYNEMGKFVAGLKTKLDKSPVKLSVETRDKLEFSIDVMAKYARLGLAEIDYRKGSYDKVLKTTDAVVGAVQKVKPDAKGHLRMKDFQVTGDILALALRANVQKGNTPKAKEILGYLNRLTGEDAGGVAETTNMLRSLIFDLQAQMKELKKAKDQAKLKETVKSFSAFIDELANKKDQALEVKDIMVLANFYSTLEEYPKAANLYNKIPEPKALNSDKLTEDEEKEVGTYWFMQIQYAKALRLSAQSREDLGKAKKVLDVLQRHKNARLLIFAEVEQIHLLEDSEKFGTPLYGLAIKGWTGIMNNPTLKSKLADDPNLKELYFNAYYGYTRCLYKTSQTEKIIAAGKEKTYLAAAAKNVLKLERATNPEGWQIVGPRFVELLSTEPKLKDEYEELKKTAK
jgi:hypothetical protein